jgi:APA family basic amino acid/polyamine antiporter
MNALTAARSAPRSLGLVTATALVVANMVGTGVFTTSGFLLADMKSPWPVLAVWVTGGVLAGLGALCYGALARRLPESGGEYLFLSRTLHPSLGYVAGWISLLVGFSAPLAAAATAFGSYAGPWFPKLSPQALGTVLIVVFSALHAINVRGGAWVQNGAVLVKVVLLLAFAGLAAGRLSATPVPAPHSAPLAIMGVSLVWVSFSYSGWNAAVYIGGEVADPERNLPRSLLLGTGIVTLLYLGLNAVFVFSAPAEQLAGKLEVGRVAATALGGPAWGDMVSALVALVLVSSVSSLIMAGPRVYARMAQDRYLPSCLAAGAGAPLNAIVLQSVVALALLWSSTFDQLLTYIGFTLGLSTAATVAGLVRIRLREGAQLRVPGWPWVPGAFLLATVAITGFAIARRPKESLAGLGTIAAGLVAWRIAEARRKRGSAPTPLATATGETQADFRNTRDT